MEWMTNALKRVQIPARNGQMLTLADKPMADITTADVEQVRVNWPRKTKAPRAGITGPDRALKRLRHIFNWSILKGLVESSPFRKAHVNVITFETEDGRVRRLEDGEEERLPEKPATRSTDTPQHLGTDPLDRVGPSVGPSPSCISEISRLRLTVEGIKRVEQMLGGAIPTPLRPGSDDDASDGTESPAPRGHAQ